MDISRRTFFSSAVAAGMMPLPFVEARSGCRSKFHEPSREIPVAGTYDVIVAGGGPAGVAAAVAAARAGAKVMLLESNGELGGIWTSGMVSLLIDFGKSDFDREITGRLKRYGAGFLRELDHRGMENHLYEPEYMKLVCEELCGEAGVAIRLHTNVTAAYRDRSGRNIDVAITESKSGREAWRAKAFIDCTGDGDLAAYAGCGYDLGVGKGRPGQPASLIALLCIPNAGPDVENCIGNGDNPFNRSKQERGERPKHVLKRKLDALGVSPSYSEPTLFRLNGSLMAFMANHEYGVRIDDSAAITAATLRARREVHNIVRALASQGREWKGMRVAATASRIGHRDSRRIHGRYMLTREDVVSGRRFEDAVTLVRSGIDIHALDRMSNDREGGSSQTFGNRFRPFEIPMRSLIARDADNLFMAGRCISGDFISHAAFRVTGSAVATGAAAGKAAAMFSKP